MTMNAGPTAPDAQSVVFRLAMLPARLIGRFRPALSDAAAVDEIRFDGAARPVFVGLAVVAVVYPIVASIAHAFGTPSQGSDALLLALRPTFDSVYSESLTFMLAAVALGLLSPALGALFMVAFIPADLLASAASTSELANNPFEELPYVAVVARAASYAFLWILAVEIPLRSRALAERWARRRDGAPRTPPYALANVVAVAFFVYVWTSAIGLLITSVYTWSMIQRAQTLGTDPTWYYWPILVIGAAVVAGLAAVWPRPVATLLPPAEVPAPEPVRRSRVVTIAREALGSLGLALLAGALMTGVAEAVVVIGGFLIAGPVMTLVLPLVPTPVRFRDATAAVRWTVAIAATGVVMFIVTKLFWDALNMTSNLGFAISAAIAVSVFRLVLDVGRPAHWRDAGSASPAVPAVVTTAIALLVVAGW
jgi:hypothetical protein